DAVECIAAYNASVQVKFHVGAIVRACHVLKPPRVVNGIEVCAELEITAGCRESKEELLPVSCQHPRWSGDALSAHVYYLKISTTAGSAQLNPRFQSELVGRIYTDCGQKD